MLKLFWATVLVVFVSDWPEGIALKNLIGTELQTCLNCVCHARSGCWSRFNCANYSITPAYWKTAGKPTTGGFTEAEAYAACMKDENCILNTLKGYMDAYGDLDCNCDGKYDCTDKLALHLFGPDCYNPKFGFTYATRFNECANDVGSSKVAEKGESCPDIEIRNTIEV